MCSFNALNCYLLKNNVSPYQTKLYRNIISIDFLGHCSAVGQIKDSQPWNSEYKTDGLNWTGAEVRNGRKRIMAKNCHEGFCDSYNYRLRLFLWWIVTKVIHRNTCETENLCHSLGEVVPSAEAVLPSRQTVKSNHSSVAGTAYADLSHPEMGFKKTQRHFFQASLQLIRYITQIYTRNYLIKASLKIILPIRKC